jgi:histidinol dehydrogenase
VSQIIQPVVVAGVPALNEWERSLRGRASFENSEIREAVARICDDVRERGDAAVLEFTRRWDFSSATTLRVPDEAVEAAMARVRKTPLWDALNGAAARIESFHQRHRPNTWLDMSAPGEVLGQRLLPLERVGVYVPGGRAAYPSTVLMAGIPARVAGVANRILATPPMETTGLPPDATLAASRIAGFNSVFAMGGAQAIAAMAYGTQSVPAVDKVVGPGNAYVNAAKRQVYGAVGIDMLAGPSEVGIVAGDEANPESVAAEWICQIEHDPDNGSLVLVFSREMAERVVDALQRQLQDLPRREIVESALRRNSRLLVVAGLNDAARLMNAYAPEHLHIDVADNWEAMALFRNAGAILLGPWSSAAHGDYVAGPCHTLPTGGAARFSNPLHTDDFLRKTSVICLGQERARELALSAMRIAEFEGLEGHRRSAARLLED